MPSDTREALESLEVTSGDLVRFLDATRENGACRECGHKQWVLHADIEGPREGGDELVAELDTEAKVIVFELEIAKLTAFQPCALIHCAFCGTMSLINYAVLARWVKKNPVAEKD